MILLGESVVWQHLLLRLILACLDFALKSQYFRGGLQILNKSDKLHQKMFGVFDIFLHWAFSLLIAQLYSRDGPAVFYFSFSHQRWKKIFYDEKD